LHFLLLRTILARTSRRWQPPAQPGKLEFLIGPSALSEPSRFRGVRQPQSSLSLALGRRI